MRILPLALVGLLACTYTQNRPQPDPEALDQGGGGHGPYLEFGAV